VAAYSASV